jgi:DNA-binding NtrC family response regulator
MATSCSPSGPADIVLIDDDPIMRDLWVKLGEQPGVRVAAFGEPADFFAVVDSYPKSTPIYVDESLTEGQSGLEVTKKLHSDHGFSELYLATGYEASDFARATWLRAVRDKMPPF